MQRKKKTNVGRAENKQRNDSYAAINRRKRNRSLMILIPIIAAVVALIAVAASIHSTKAPAQPMVIHVHPHLSVTLDGKPLTVPAQIGIDPSLSKDHSLDQYGMQAMSDGMSGMAPLHTHDTSGTIHVESSIYRNYTLGQFLSNWGLDLNGKTVKASVDGTPVSDYKNIILRDGEQISLDVRK